MTMTYQGQKMEMPSTPYLSPPYQQQDSLSVSDSLSQLQRLSSTTPQQSLSVQNSVSSLPEDASWQPRRSTPSPYMARPDSATPRASSTGSVELFSTTDPSGKTALPSEEKENVSSQDPGQVLDVVNGSQQSSTSQASLSESQQTCHRGTETQSAAEALSALCTSGFVSPK
jgi:hypothetical protein